MHRTFKSRRRAMASLAFLLTMSACGRADDESSLAAAPEPALDPERELVQFARSLEATHDVGLDVSTVLESSVLEKACPAHWNRLDPATGKLSEASRHDPDHVRAMLQCGKWIFFSASFASKLAIPENMLKAVPRIFEAEAGSAFSKLGLIENPEDTGMPVGFTRLTSKPWGPLAAFTGPARGITCATCHFGQMPDGRFAAGMPNQDLDFGKLNALLLYTAWRADSRAQDASVWAPALQDYYRGLDGILAKSKSTDRALFDVAKLVAKLKQSDSFYKFTGASRPILAESSTFLSGTRNQYYASSPLLPVQGKSYWMSAPQIWNLENFRGAFEAGHARPLSTFSPVKNAEDFLALALIFQTGYKTYAQPQYVDALLLYMRSLKTPTPLTSAPAALALQGKKIFATRCQSCHNGAAGETLQAYPATELGTPSVLVDLLGGYASPKALSTAIYEQTLDTIGYAPLITGGIYGRPLRGIYARRQLMINGSVAELDAAFCLNGPRGVEKPADPGLSDAVHLDLCEDYDDHEKLALKAFLQNWN